MWAYYQTVFQPNLFPAFITVQWTQSDTDSTNSTKPHADEFSSEAKPYHPSSQSAQCWFV